MAAASWSLLLFKLSSTLAWPVVICDPDNTPCTDDGRSSRRMEFATVARFLPTRCAMSSWRMLKSFEQPLIGRRALRSGSSPSRCRFSISAISSTSRSSRASRCDDGHFLQPQLARRAPAALARDQLPACRSPARTISGWTTPCSRTDSISSRQLLRSGIACAAATGSDALQRHLAHDIAGTG